MIRVRSVKDTEFVLNMSALKISQFLDDFPLSLVEPQMLISILLRPFTMLSNALRCQERLHFIVNFIEFAVQFFDPLDSFHGQPDELFDFCLFSLHRESKPSPYRAPAFVPWLSQRDICDTA